MKTLCLPSGRIIPVLGQGTWGMGENSSKRKEEIAALRMGLDLGMLLIDTAEIYANGGTEEMVAEAIEGRRKEVFLVSKVSPYNATKLGTIEACVNSLLRLRTDYIDLFLLHWRGTVPLAETLDAFQILKRTGKILDYGVSNFDPSDMEEASILYGGDGIVTNQVLYNLMRRGIEWDLLPLCRNRNLPIMAYSPIEQGKLIHNTQLKVIASRHSATPAQVALSWLLQQEGVIAIPKASNMAHVKENRAALELKLTDVDLEELEQAFPPPFNKVPLVMI